jgi:hypothetical protein
VLFNKVKSKMVSLRLSLEDFERYRSASIALGITNISEFARMAMNRVVSDPPERDIEVLIQIQKLEQRLAEVAGALEVLREKVPVPHPAAEHPVSADQLAAGDQMAGDQMVDGPEHPEFAKPDGPET